MRNTRPSFLRDGRVPLPVEYIGPWSQHGQAVDSLSKRLARERDPGRRADLAQEHAAMMAKAARANPAGVAPPLTFDQRQLLNERTRRLPELCSILVSTIDELSYWVGDNVGPLLEQTTQEFAAAVRDVVATTT